MYFFRLKEKQIPFELPNNNITLHLYIKFNSDNLQLHIMCVL